MNTDLSKTQGFLQPPGAVGGASPHASPHSSPHSSPLSSPVSRRRGHGRRQRTCTMGDVVNLQANMARAQNTVLAELNINEQALSDRLTRVVNPSGGLTSSDSSDSLSSISSCGDETASVTSTDSDRTQDEDIEVPPGDHILELPAYKRLLDAAEPHLLANLLVGNLSEDEMLSIPTETLQNYCLQAVADIQYMRELSEKIQANLHLLELPEIAVKAIRQKLEKIEEPFCFLISDLNSCLKGFRRGDHFETTRDIAPVSPNKPRGKSQLVICETNLVRKLAFCWIYIIRQQEEWRKAMPSPAQLMPGAKLPDVMRLSEDQRQSAEKTMNKLIADIEVMTRLWRHFGELVRSKTKAAGTGKERHSEKDSGAGPKPGCQNSFLLLLTLLFIRLPLRLNGCSYR